MNSTTQRAALPSLQPQSPSNILDAVDRTFDRTDPVEIVPWLDPLVDELGYPVGDPYVETFWLPVLGPTATWLLRRLVDGLHREPEGYSVDMVDLARCLGLSHSPGRHGPFARALHRCTMFGASQQVSMTPVPVHAVRRTMPRVARRHLDRLPASLRALHEAWPATRS